MKKLMFTGLFFLGVLVGSCSSDDQDKVTSCADRIQESQDAIFDLIDATEDNYTTLCVELRTALQLQIDSCGDPDGNLQDAISDLEDCSYIDEANGG